ncbi:uncharacterized protein [Miscanthus floridulus]|uniref:uncharacterized protein isoform X2 n=1 Tax=Miscanthus floridulus TaxID=154761 RepID=UPI00345AA5D5
MGGGWGAVEAEGVASPRRIRRRRVRCRVAPKVIPVATAPARSSRGGFGLPPTSPPPSPARLDRRRKPRPHSPTARVIQVSLAAVCRPLSLYLLLGFHLRWLCCRCSTRMHELQIFSPLPLSPATAEPFWGFNIRLDPTGAPAASHGPGRTATRVQAKMRKRMESVAVSYFASTLTAVLRCTLLPVRATVTVSEWLLNWKTNIDVHDRWGSTVILVVGDDTQHISRGILYDKAIQRIGQRLQDQGRSS